MCIIYVRSVQYYFPAHTIHASITAQQGNYRAWVQLSPDAQVLVAVPEGVLPHLAEPVLLGSFLTRVLDRGGLAGMLALAGIFALVSRHGLEYPRFYERLYGLLTPAACLVCWGFLPK